MSELPALIAAADLVVTCTGAPGHVITAESARAAVDGRNAAARPLVLLDLALPRDVEPGVADIPGVIVTDLETLQAAGSFRPGEQAIAAARQVVAEALEDYQSAGRAERVRPTVVALRAMAASVVESELTRLAGRIGPVLARGTTPGAPAVLAGGTTPGSPEMEAAVLDEVARSMNRIADKLLHAPTVRVKELAGSPGADSYEDALRVLFDLDPATVQSVAAPDASLSAALLEGKERAR
jgi:glutamyl-tRNA reductase